MRRLACFTFATLCVSAAKLADQQPTKALCGGPNTPLAARYWTQSGDSKLELQSNGTFTLELPKDKTFGRWEATGNRSAPLVFYIGDAEKKVECTCRYGGDTDAPSTSTYIQFTSS